MTDKEILGTIYRWSKLAHDRNDSGEIAHKRFKDFVDFIEQEWQRQDDEERTVTDYWCGPDPCTTDVKEIERHRGLEMGEDGTVNSLD